MGRIEQTEDGFIYRQSNGDITAWFDSIAEKQELAHEGSPAYRRVFYALVLIGAAYLAVIFMGV